MSGLQNALQRLLMLASKIKDLSHLRVRGIVWINSARAGAAVVDLKHDPCGSLAVLIEHTLQHVNDKLNGRRSSSV
jgi:hypothetical protein